MRELDFDICELSLARRHVQGGRRIVAKQEALLARIAARGDDIAAAESLLDSFRQTLALFEDDLQRLVSDSPANPIASATARVARADGRSGN